MNWLKTVYFNNEYNEKLMFDVTNTIISVNNKIFVSTENVR